MSFLGNVPSHVSNFVALAAKYTVGYETWSGAFHSALVILSARARRIANQPHLQHFTFSEPLLEAVDLKDIDPTPARVTTACRDVAGYISKPNVLAILKNSETWKDDLKVVVLSLLWISADANPSSRMVAEESLHILLLVFTSNQQGKLPMFRMLLASLQGLPSLTEDGPEERLQSVAIRCISRYVSRLHPTECRSYAIKVLPQLLLFVSNARELGQITLSDGLDDLLTVLGAYFSHAEYLTFIEALVAKVHRCPSMILCRPLAQSLSTTLLHCHPSPPLKQVLGALEQSAGHIWGDPAEPAQGPSSIDTAIETDRMAALLHCLGRVIPVLLRRSQGVAPKDIKDFLHRVCELCLSSMSLACTHHVVPQALSVLQTAILAEVLVDSWDARRRAGRSAVSVFQTLTKLLSNPSGRVRASVTALFMDCLGELLWLWVPVESVDCDSFLPIENFYVHSTKDISPECVFRGEAFCSLVTRFLKHDDPSLRGRAAILAGSRLIAASEGSFLASTYDCWFGDVLAMALHDESATSRHAALAALARLLSLSRTSGDCGNLGLRSRGLTSWPSNKVGARCALVASSALRTVLAVPPTVTWRAKCIVVSALAVSLTPRKRQASDDSVVHHLLGMCYDADPRVRDAAAEGMSHVLHRALGLDVAATTCLDDVSQLPLQAQRDRGLSYCNDVLEKLSHRLCSPKNRVELGATYAVLLAVFTTRRGKPTAPPPRHQGADDISMPSSTRSSVATTIVPAILWQLRRTSLMCDLETHSRGLLLVAQLLSAPQASISDHCYAESIRDSEPLPWLPEDTRTCLQPYMPVLIAHVIRTYALCIRAGAISPGVEDPRPIAELVDASGLLAQLECTGLGTCGRSDDDSFAWPNPDLSERLPEKVYDLLNFREDKIYSMLADSLHKVAKASRASRPSESTSTTPSSLQFSQLHAPYFDIAVSEPLARTSKSNSGDPLVSLMDSCLHALRTASSFCIEDDLMYFGPLIVRIARHALAHGDSQALDLVAAVSRVYVRPARLLSNGDLQLGVSVPTSIRPKAPLRLPRSVGPVVGPTGRALAVTAATYAATKHVAPAKNGHVEEHENLPVRLGGQDESDPSEPEREFACLLKEVMEAYDHTHDPIIHSSILRSVAHIGRLGRSFGFLRLLGDGEGSSLVVALKSQLADRRHVVPGVSSWLVAAFGFFLALADVPMSAQPEFAVEQVRLYQWAKYAMETCTKDANTSDACMIDGLTAVIPAVDLLLRPAFFRKGAHIPSAENILDGCEEFRSFVTRIALKYLLTEGGCRLTISLLRECRTVAGLPQWKRLVESVTSSLREAADCKQVESNAVRCNTLVTLFEDLPEGSLTFETEIFLLCLCLKSLVEDESDTAQCLSRKSTVTELLLRAIQWWRSSYPQTGPVLVLLRWVQRRCSQVGSRFHYDRDDSVLFSSFRGILLFLSDPDDLKVWLEVFVVLGLLNVNSIPSLVRHFCSDEHPASDPRVNEWLLASQVAHAATGAADAQEALRLVSCFLETHKPFTCLRYLPPWADTSFDDLGINVSVIPRLLQSLSSNDLAKIVHGVADWCEETYLFDVSESDTEILVQRVAALFRLMPPTPRTLQVAASVLLPRCHGRTFEVILAWHSSRLEPSSSDVSAPHSHASTSSEGPSPLFSMDSVSELITPAAEQFGSLPPYSEGGAIELLRWRVGQLSGNAVHLRRPPLADVAKVDVTIVAKLLQDRVFDEVEPSRAAVSSSATSGQLDLSLLAPCFFDLASHVESRLLLLPISAALSGLSRRFVEAWHSNCSSRASSFSRPKPINLNDTRKMNGAVNPPSDRLAQNVIAFGSICGKILLVDTPCGDFMIWELTASNTWIQLETITVDVHVETASIGAKHPGAFVIAAAEGNKVHLWRSREDRVVVQGHTSRITCVQVSASSELFASGTEGGVVRLWETDTLKCTRQLEGHTGSISDLQFSSVDARLLAASQDCTVRVWSVDTGEVLLLLDAESPLLCSGVNNDASLIFTASGHALATWDYSNGNHIKSCKYESATITHAALHATLPLVAFADDEGVVRLWDLDSDDIATIHTEVSVRLLKFISSILLSVSGTGSIFMYDLTSRETFPAFQIPTHHHINGTLEKDSSSSRNLDDSSVQANTALPMEDNDVPWLLWRDGIHIVRAIAALARGLAGSAAFPSGASTMVKIKNHETERLVSACEWSDIVSVRAKTCLDASLAVAILKVLNLVSDVLLKNTPLETDSGQCLAATICHTYAVLPHLSPASEVLYKDIAPEIARLVSYIAYAPLPLPIALRAHLGLRFSGDGAIAKPHGLSGADMSRLNEYELRDTMTQLLLSKGIHQLRAEAQAAWSETPLKCSTSNELDLLRLPYLLLLSCEEFIRSFTYSPWILMKGVNDSEGAEINPEKRALQGEDLQTYLQLIHVVGWRGLDLFKSLFARLLALLDTDIVLAASKGGEEVRASSLADGANAQLQALVLTGLVALLRQAGQDVEDTRKLHASTPQGYCSLDDFRLSEVLSSPWVSRLKRVRDVVDTALHAYVPPCSTARKLQEEYRASIETYDEVTTLVSVLTAILKTHDIHPHLLYVSMLVVDQVIPLLSDIQLEWILGSVLSTHDRLYPIFFPPPSSYWSSGRMNSSSASASNSTGVDIDLGTTVSRDVVRAPLFAPEGSCAWARTRVSWVPPTDNASISRVSVWIRTCAGPTMTEVLCKLAGRVAVNGKAEAAMAAKIRAALSGALHADCGRWWEHGCRGLAELSLPSEGGNTQSTNVASSPQKRTPNLSSSNSDSSMGRGSGNGVASALIGPAISLVEARLLELFDLATQPRSMSNSCREAIVCATLGTAFFRVLRDSNDGHPSPQGGSSASPTHPNQSQSLPHFLTDVLSRVNSLVVQVKQQQVLEINKSAGWDKSKLFDQQQKDAPGSQRRWARYRSRQKWWHQDSFLPLVLKHVVPWSRTSPRTDDFEDIISCNTLWIAIVGVERLLIAASSRSGPFVTPKQVNHILGSLENWTTQVPDWRSLSFLLYLSLRVSILYVGRIPGSINLLRAPGEKNEAADSPSCVEDVVRLVRTLGVGGSMSHSDSNSAHSQTVPLGNSLDPSRLAGVARQCCTEVVSQLIPDFVPANQAISLIIGTAKARSICDAEAIHLVLHAFGQLRSANSRLLADWVSLYIKSLASSDVLSHPSQTDSRSTGLVSVEGDSRTIPIIRGLTILFAAIARPALLRVLLWSHNTPSLEDLALLDGPTADMMCTREGENVWYQTVSAIVFSESGITIPSIGPVVPVHLDGSLLLAAGANFYFRAGLDPPSVVAFQRLLGKIIERWPHLPGTAELFTLCNMHDIRPRT